MDNSAVYDELLWLYIVAIIISMVLFFGFVTLIFFILKWCKLVSNKKIFKRCIWIMGIFFLSISLIMTFPAFIDICADSYCTQNEIVSVKIASETASSRRINANHTLICQTQNGDAYECYDYLYSIENMEAHSENNCIIYAKHSKLLLDWVKVD